MFFVLSASPAWAQKDKVTRRDQSVVDGSVSQDSFKGVKVGNTEIPPDQVLRIDYKDAPPSFTSALDAIAEGKWEDAISGLKSAWQKVKEGEVDAKTNKRVPWPCRPWFDQYYLFHLGYCERQLAKFDEALTHLTACREMKDGHPKEPSRFWADAFELSLECLRERGKPEDLDEMTKLIATIDAAPKDLQDGLRKRARKQQAELLFDKKEYARARELFEGLQRESDPDLKAGGTAGVIKCLEELKNVEELKRFCARVLADEGVPVGVRLIASNAVARVLRDAKDLRGAIRQYVDSVVRFNPGRGSGFERDHEEALYFLGLCYRQMAADSKEATAKKYYYGAAASAFREVALVYPSGRRRDESLKLADQMDQEAAKVK
ncbi:MAG: hypothetical protein HYY17_01955 [Planctomycetes bacterium]|nr:hypothetical protein [Planctomycetota bacterium]